MKRIWTSELNAKNKSIAHNCFALPVLIPTIGILEWNFSEIEAVDIRTRKILCMIGNFHKNSDKHRLYAKRAEGGRGLKSSEESYIMRIVSLKRHIVKDQKNNRFLENVLHHEKDRVVRLGEEYERLYLEEKEMNEDQEGRNVTAENQNTNAKEQQGKLAKKTAAWILI